MVTALTWTSYLDTMARLAVVEPDNVDFLALAPQMVNYAELRMCRDLDFLFTRVVAFDSFVVPGTRSFTWPIDRFVTIETMDIITPSGIGVNPDTGVRHPMLPVTRDFITNVYPDNNLRGLPRYFVMSSQNAALVAPIADQIYTVSMFGTGRPETLSATNPSTVISSQLPDLFIMASMVWISGYQRNFGRQSDDPQQAVSYEQQYMTLLKSAMVEEVRKKFQSAAWTSMTPAPLASPSRQAPAAG